jgi:hypothetical protein
MHVDSAASKALLPQQHSVRLEACAGEGRTAQ